MTDKMTQNDLVLQKAWMPILEGLEHRQLMATGTIQSLPFRLDFNQSVTDSILDKDGQGTGLTRVQANKNGNQYQPSKIDLDLTTGTLKLTTVGSSLAGSNGGVDNTQTNALETQFNGNQSGFTIETRLIGPLSSINDRFEQAGIYFGADQDNYVKLVAYRNWNGQYLGFEDEFSNATGGVSSTRNGTNAQTNIGSFTSINTLDLRIVGDAATGKVSAYFRVNSDSGNYTKVGFDITVAAEKRSLYFNATSRAGLLAAHKNDIGPLTATFDYFGINAGTPIVGSPSISGLENIAANATGISQTTQLRAAISWPVSGRAVNASTLSSASVRLYQTSNGATVAASLSISSTGNSVILTPSSQLSANTAYTFEITSALKDTSGASFVPFARSFSTGANAQLTANIGVDVPTLYFSDVYQFGSNGSASSPSQKFRISNSGVGALSISSLVVGGAGGSEFSLASSVSLPASIEAGGYLDVSIAFTAAEIGLRIATLTINSNDPDSPALVVNLRGLGTAGEGGNLEPSLQRIMDLYQIPITVGDTTRTRLTSLRRPLLVTRSRSSGSAPPAWVR